VTHDNHAKAGRPGPNDRGPRIMPATGSRKPFCSRKNRRKNPGETPDDFPRKIPAKRPGNAPKMGDFFRPFFGPKTQIGRKKVGGRLFAQNLKWGERGFSGRLGGRRARLYLRTGERLADDVAHIFVSPVTAHRENREFSQRSRVRVCAHLGAACSRSCVGSSRCLSVDGGESRPLRFRAGHTP
jgi:hypothetical protein